MNDIYDYVIFCGMSPFLDSDVLQFSSYNNYKKLFNKCFFFFLHLTYILRLRT